MLDANLRELVKLCVVVDQLPDYVFAQNENLGEALYEAERHAVTQSGCKSFDVVVERLEEDLEVLESARELGFNQTFLKK